MKKKVQALSTVEILSKLKTLHVLVSLHRKKGGLSSYLKYYEDYIAECSDEILRRSGEIDGGLS